MTWRGASAEDVAAILGGSVTGQEEGPSGVEEVKGAAAVRISVEAQRILPPDILALAQHVAAPSPWNRGRE